MVVVSASDDGLLRSGFGQENGEAVAFVVAGGREVVTLGVAGKDLASARLVDPGVNTARRVEDPVSRLVIFLADASTGKGGLRLAARSPAGGVLKRPGEGEPLRVVGKVDQVGGRYLPFHLIKLKVSGEIPSPGTPLLDQAGRVAAVVHQPAGGDELFALPAEVVSRVLEDARDGEISRAWLGVTLQPGSGEARVERVVPGSPAEAAGMRPGDVIREISGLRIDGYGDAVNAFFLLRPERPTRVKVRRGSGDVVLEVTPGKGRG